MAAMHPAMAQQTPSTPNPNSVDRCWKSSVIPIPFMVGDLIAIEILDLTINSNGDVPCGCLPEGNLVGGFSLPL